MNQFEKKMGKIIEVLLETEKYMTLEALSQQIGVSKRSIQNYIYKIEGWFSEIGLNEIKVLKKQGYGIKLLVNHEDKNKLVKKLRIDNINIFEDMARRRLETLKALLFSNDELTIQFFADHFYVSRTAVLKDLEWISQWLSKYGLKLFKCQHRGIGIEGNELCRRNAIAGFFDIYKTNEKDVLTGFNCCGRLPEEKYTKLKSVYGKIDILNVCNIIEDAEKTFDFFLTDEYFLSIVTHLVIGIARLTTGKNVEDHFMPPDHEYTSLELKTSEYISSRLESEFNLKMPESERIYICIHLMSYNTFNHSDSAISYIPQKIELLAIKLIDCVDVQLGTTFATDKILFFGVISHLKTSLYRLEENIPIKTSAMEDFLNPTAEIVNAVSKASVLYEEVCNVKSDEEEIITVSLHFILSQKRNARKKKALLVCNNGIIAGFKLQKVLYESFVDIEIVDICSSLQLAYKAENEYDFIISTVALENCSKPVADLSHVSKSDYTKFLDEFMFSLM